MAYLDEEINKNWRNPELEDMEAEARKAGMSYGQYAALKTMQAMKNGTYEPPKHLELPEERCERLYKNSYPVNVYDKPRKPSAKNHRLKEFDKLPDGCKQCQNVWPDNDGGLWCRQECKKRSVN